jgi:methionine-rich copper-binding protein CopC
VPAAVSYNPATRTATLDPTGELASGTTYTAGLTSGLTDPSGNPLAPVTWSFTTAVDATAPSVSARTPNDGATAVAPSSRVTVTFDEPVQGVGANSFSVRTTAGAPVAATVGYDAATRVATLTPSAPLAWSTGYTATLAGGPSAIRDLAGNALAGTTWSFRTPAPPDTTAPSVTTRTPAANATAVVQSANLTATFSEPVTGVGPSSFTLKNAATGAAVGATSVVYNATTRVATFDPGVTLAADTRYTATLSTGIRDAAGNALAATSWTFTTGPAPTVTARTPAVNGTRVGRTANITATFSEAVAGVAAGTFTLKNAATGTAVTGTVSRNGTTNQWILNPGATLAASTTYTVTLTGGAAAIRDARGNPLTTTRWSFTTGTA